MKKIIFLTIITALFATNVLSADDTRNLSTKPKEIYGKSNDVKIRIGNGGAGPTGILRILAEDFLAQNNKNYAIAWYQDISPNTLKQLQNSIIDIALVYEKSQGEAALAAGWASNYNVIFNDHFLIIGPKQNPAKLTKGDNIENSLLKISAFGEKKSAPIFLSRDDNSGTNIKEKSLWEIIGQKPWKAEPSWYEKYHVFPKEALIYADTNSLYTITDWGTWLSNNKNLKNSRIYLRGKKELLNPCFALLGKDPQNETLEFLSYLKSERAQKIIEEFGKNKFSHPLFTPAKKEEFSNS